ncbi:MAG: hypothetical protein CMO20_04515 [Thermoplasmata archaeon]|nr:hypothetical protein [Thermoplasmata archaeon]
MDSQIREFLIIRCNDCNSHFGTLKSSEIYYCPKCGQNGEYPIVDRARDSNELSKKVSMANVPPELREELLQRTDVIEYVDYDVDTISAKQLLRIISNNVDEDGLINLQQIEIELTKKKIDSPNALQLVEMAESQGLLMRKDNHGWIWLG